MRLRVFALIHATDWPESSEEVRGLYRSERAAEDAMTLHEAFEGGRWFRAHDDRCCEIRPMNVLDRPELPYHGPARPALVRDTYASAIIPRSVEPVLRDLFAAHYSPGSRLVIDPDPEC